MEIIIAETAGFCFGVKNAVKKVKEEVENVDNRKVYCLGELVHNGRVMKELKENGLFVVEDIKDVPQRSKLIIRAHGEPESTYKVIKEKEIEVLDMTCPKVAEIHRKIKKYGNKAFYTLVIGEKKHAEIIGHVGYTDFCYVIETKEEIEDVLEFLKGNDVTNIYIVSQTTFSSKLFDEYVEIIKHGLKEISDLNLVIDKTICNATEKRQEEAEEISKKVDLMIVIGGKNSSNSKKLFELCKENCKKAIIVEKIEELNMDEIKRYGRVGVVAGASTPDSSIKEIIESLRG